VAAYFADEQAAIDDLQATQEAATRDLEEFVEEHSGEEGLLADATNDKGKVTKGLVKERLKTIHNEADSDEECVALKRCQKLIEAESSASKAVKDAQAELDAQVLAQYPKLKESEIKGLVVDHKWFASLQSAINGEVQRLTQQLASRIKELEQRYAQTLQEQEHEVEALGSKVEGHLKKMGVTL
jgi:type I restriction enzyme M protein